MHNTEGVRELDSKVAELELGTMITEDRLLAIMESLGITKAGGELPGGELGVDTAQADFPAEDC